MSKIEKLTNTKGVSMRQITGLKIRQITNQQGDVLLRKISKLPKEAMKVEVPHKILQHGEGGHCHKFADNADVEFYATGKQIENLDLISRITELAGEVFIKVNRSSVLVHGLGPNVTDDGQIHNLQIVEPGIYPLDIVREVNPFEKELTNLRVRD